MKCIFVILDNDFYNHCLLVDLLCNASGQEHADDRRTEDGNEVDADEEADNEKDQVEPEPEKIELSVDEANELKAVVKVWVG